MTDMSKIRSSVERALLLMAVVAILVVSVEKMWEYSCGQTERAIVGARMRMHMEMAEQGKDGVEFDVLAYLKHARRFVSNILFDAQPRKVLGGIEMDERTMKRMLAQLADVLKSHRHVFAVLLAGGCDRVSVTVGRLFGSGFPYPCSIMDTAQHGYIMRFRPPGFDEVRIELDAMGMRIATDINTYIAAVVVQHLLDCAWSDKVLVKDGRG